MGPCCIHLFLLLHLFLSLPETLFFSVHAFLLMKKKYPKILPIKLLVLRTIGARALPVLNIGCFSAFLSVTVAEEYISVAHFL